MKIDNGSPSKDITIFKNLITKHCWQIAFGSSISEKGLLSLRTKEMKRNYMTIVKKKKKSRQRTI